MANTNNKALPSSNGKAVASLVLGIVGLIAWFIPLFGYPVNIVGLVLGARTLQTKDRPMALAGFVMSIVGLALTVINSIAGVFIALR